ncbi:hypothetical protein [Cellulomonas sp. RIT-PI-Y]|uniref:hypothetical protein n=1 Tax=Cellulomonas sp. RIT-PI-Y TaxID=3035297 RepID=UPI0021D93C28|nr:hypothetical protein [Cellulomonas sp. RIT-PI-Y]
MAAPESRVRRRSWQPAALITHAAVVLVVTVLLLALGLQRTADANIGGGIAYLASLPFGVPWTFLLPAAPADWSSQTLVLCAAGAAWWNVAIHAVLWQVLRARR